MCFCPWAMLLLISNLIGHAAWPVPCNLVRRKEVERQIELLVLKLGHVVFAVMFVPGRLSKWLGDADQASGPLAHGCPRCRRALLLRKRASAKSFGLYRQNDNIVEPSPSCHPGVLCKGFIRIPFLLSVCLSPF